MVHGVSCRTRCATASCSYVHARAIAQPAHVDRSSHPKMANHGGLVFDVTQGPPTPQHSGDVCTRAQSCPVSIAVLNIPAGAFYLSPHCLCVCLFTPPLRAWFSASILRTDLEGALLRIKQPLQVSRRSFIRVRAPHPPHCWSMRAPVGCGNSDADGVRL